MKSTTILKCFLSVLGVLSIAAIASDRPEVGWIKENAVKLQTVEAGHGFSDMQPLKKIVGNARIVSLGEATHGTREFFQLKHRMLEFLATEMGFSIFSIEANMPEAYRLNDYVLNGQGDPVSLIKGMYFWTWDTQEVLDMVLWMREFNKSGKGRLQFTGFDMQFPDVALGIVNDFIAQAEPAYANSISPAAEMVKNAKPSASGGPFGVATASLPAKDALGKKIRLSGYIKTENVYNGSAGLWCRVDGPSGRALAFDNMQNRGVAGTTDWKRYVIELPVAPEATNIVFGALFPGDGAAWFDDLQIELDDKPYENNDLFDLSFEAPSIKGFYTGGDGYSVQLDSKIFHSGKQSLRMNKPTAFGTAFGVAGASFPAKVALGKKIRLSGYIKTENVSNGYAGLWCRVDGSSGSVLAFDNMQNRGVAGTTDWNRYVIELPVPPDAKNIGFGALFPGDGAAWFDELKIELDDKPYENNDLFDLDFEAPNIKGFSTGGDGYSVQLDSKIFHSGKQSLRMSKLPVVNNPKAMNAGIAASTWKTVLDHMTAAREEYQKKGLTLGKIDWAIQNAQVVWQYARMQAKETSRDDCMAENVKWILDQNPGAKIVLWAHNGHVSTETVRGMGPMGSTLRRMYGNNMVVFGFAFNQGSFQAIEQGKGLHDFTVPPAPEGSFDATLASAGIPILALDLKAIPKTGPVYEWFGQSHIMRSIGAVFSDASAAQYLMNMNAAQIYDAILFVEHTSAARKNEPR